MTILMKRMFESYVIFASAKAVACVGSPGPWFESYVIFASAKAHGAFSNLFQLFESYVIFASAKAERCKICNRA